MSVRLGLYLCGDTMYFTSLCLDFVCSKSMVVSRLGYHLCDEW